MKIFIQQLVKILALAFTVLLPACITPFIPDNIDTSGGLLVVEGDILLNDTTKIYLSYSIPIDQENKVDYVKNAHVWVEDENGMQYTGVACNPADEAPYFAINTIGLNQNIKYKLCITLQNSKRYESDLVPVLVAPAIDSIGFIINKQKTAVDFYVNTQGADDASRYYKWNYNEDWEIRSLYFATYYYNTEKDSILPLPYEQNTYYCWNKAASSAILLAKTDQLEKNIVQEKILTRIFNDDRRISYLYALEVRQMSITKEAYDYWSTLEKNSEEIGGIFAPQPSELYGNIRCLSDPDEETLGYISAGIIAIKRSFFRDANMGVYEGLNCTTMKPPYTKYREWADAGYLVVEGSGTSWKWEWKTCVDCRHYGTKKKPAFWPNDHI